MRTREFVVSAILLTLIPTATFADSLIDPDSYRGIAADRRAYRLGDTLTVVVLEAAQAESRAGTGSDREFAIDADARDSVSQHDAGLGMRSGSDDSGRTSRQGRLRAQLSVRVVGLHPNGLLEVTGEQSIIINGENQRIIISGLVRTDDIEADNSIPSSRLSQARIEFTGEGEVSDGKKAGVLKRLFSWLGF